MIARAVSVLFAAGLLSAQPTTPATFEVVTVKPNPNCTSPSGGPSPGHLQITCVPLRNLIRAAYALLGGENLSARPVAITGGPAWLDSDRWDITATARGNPPMARMMGPMLQPVLEDRFQLKLHKESKESPVYALIVADGGPKLTPAKAGACQPLDLRNRDMWAGEGPQPCGMPHNSYQDGVFTTETFGATLDEFAGRVLGINFDRPVVDKTGLTGRYDIHLEYTRDNLTGPLSLDSAPILTALREQLGLKLVSDKAPLPVIVIDSAQKPSGN